MTQHQRGDLRMAQGLLPFQYEAESSSGGVTALGGLPLYLDLIKASGLADAVRRHLRVAGDQGWLDVQMLVALLALNLAGGDCVEDLERLEGDSGFAAVVREVERRLLGPAERRVLKRRWRRERRRSLPSPCSLLAWLGRFHSQEEEGKRQKGTAFIPAMTSQLAGLGLVNRALLGFLQSHRRERVATLDMDATLVESHKRQALYCYKKFKAYQPLNCWWAEQRVDVPESLTHPISFVITLVLITFLHVVLGEMVPKNLALAGPEKSAMFLAPVLSGIVWLVYPVLWLLNELANLLLRLMRVKPKQEVTSAFTRDEVSALVAESRSGGMIELSDERLLQGALRFGDRTARSVLLPMDTVRTLPADITPAEAEEISAESFSRFPIREQDGSLSGYVHLKDLLQNDPAKRRRPIDRSIIRELPSVSVTDSLADVQEVMRASSAHLALVRDTEGPAHRTPVLGMVTLEDVIEELVGVIRDDSRRQHTA